MARANPINILTLYTFFKLLLNWENTVSNKVLILNFTSYFVNVSLQQWGQRNTRKRALDKMIKHEINEKRRLLKSNRQYTTVNKTERIRKNKNIWKYVTLQLVIYPLTQPQVANQQKNNKKKMQWIFMIVLN